MPPPPPSPLSSRSRAINSAAPSPSPLSPPGPQTTPLSFGATPLHCTLPHYADSTFALQSVTFPPGANTGWHYHPGTLFVIVEEGDLLHYGPDGKLRTYHAGDAFIEPPGPDHVHCGAAPPHRPVRLLAFYVTPQGQSLTVPAHLPRVWEGREMP
ncbi:hypothetical protein GCM10022403_049250 [Streptomyces coacervatus]|uniref:Cupin type-2 domain-containing protein n=1 Tax=Streptomyces coacervatus TaxID=647381 RepID=A0ABP7I6V5_9ACTN|nr:cupin domain-containing protein [Streptomyces coacervatus]MDF2266228.1 cupin domain-containing protein [Streptomyces coacervatus]